MDSLSGLRKRRPPLGDRRPAEAAIVTADDRSAVTQSGELIGSVFSQISSALAECSVHRDLTRWSLQSLAGGLRIRACTEGRLDRRLVEAGTVRQLRRS
ncbi:hypothetical protein B5K06_15785 [Rhizobium grahamii]|uniref:Uncharacterized protein n=1 Tax=Rhizobium grahamii TaxID=1120045 RepID=A0A370KNP3_9HYPH|nr:hypothetical protein B5K06_15785 [Rhizobium grahamii]